MDVNVEERRRQVESLVRRSSLVKLAAPVHIAARILRRLTLLFGGNPAGLPTPTALRRTVERGLVFAVPQGAVSLYPTLLLIPATLITVQLAWVGPWPGALVFMSGSVGATLLLQAHAMLGLYRQLTRSIVVSARVKATQVRTYVSGGMAVSVEYVFEGLPCCASVALPGRVTGSPHQTLEILVDRKNPYAPLVLELFETILESWPRALPYSAAAVSPKAWTPPAPPDPFLAPHLRAAGIARYVSRNLGAKFAPIVALADRLLDRRTPHSGTTPALSAAPPLGWVPLRPTLTKVLAFDSTARWPMFLVLAILVYALPYAIGGLTEFIQNSPSGGTPTTAGASHKAPRKEAPRLPSRGRRSLPPWAALVAGVVASAITLGGLPACFIFMAWRLRELRRLFATCVVLRARVIAAVPYQTSHLENMLRLTLVYVCAGVSYEALLVYNRKAGALVGWTPEVIVNPRNLSQVFLRDFYA